MIDFWVNGQSVRRAAQSVRSLMACLRDDLRLTGTKDGCNAAGHCGTCTVLIDGQPALACRMALDAVNGKRVLTIEGLALPTSNLHPLQQSFIANHAVQCGFCTPGMILAAKALLDRNPAPSLTEIKDALACNLCRCTGYQKIFEAILAFTPNGTPLLSVPDYEPIARSAARNAARSAPRSDSEVAPVVGRSVPNKGDEDKVRGNTLYSADVYREGMLIGKAVWSEHPHAEIVSIDAAAAQAMPGVAAVLTAKDVRGTNLIGPILRDQPALAE